MNQLVENIVLVIENFYQCNIGIAYQKLTTCISQLGEVIVGMEKENQIEILMVLEQVLSIMEQKDSQRLVRVLQYELLPCLEKENAYVTMKPEQTAVVAFARQYQNLAKNSVLLIYGYGDGSYPETILNICATDVKVLFFEPASELDDTILQHMKTMCHSHNNVIIIANVGDARNGCYPFSDLPKVLKELIAYHNRNNMHMGILPGYKELYPDLYADYFRRVELHMQLINTNMQTASAIGGHAVRNNIGILSYIPESYSLDSLMHAFPKELPAIIISAGPSLAKNIHELKKAKNHALLVCVDTAAKTVLQEDIIPDIIVTVDPRKALNLFDDPRIGSIPIIGSTDMSVKALDKIQCEKLILASVKFPFVKELYKKYNYYVDELESGGSVATLAYSFCKEIGIQKIILVGQDLALTNDQMYVGKEKIQFDQFKRELIEVDAIYSGKINTTRDYYYYLKWFEQRIEMYKDLQVIDATEGGAKIHGAQVCTLKEALSLYAEKAYDIEKIFAEMKPAFTDEQREEVYAMIQNHLREYELWESKLTEGVEWSLLCMDYYDNPSSKTDFNQIQEYNGKMNALCNEFEGSTVEFLIQRQIDATCLEKYLKICETQVEAGTREQYLLMKDYFECLLTATKDILALSKSS